MTIPAQTIVARDLIIRAMTLINAIAAGEVPVDSELNDALITLNELLDSLSTRPLNMYGSSNQDFTLTPGQYQYDWGTDIAGVTFRSERPVWVNNVTCIRNGVSTPVDIVSQEEYDMIPLKQTPSPITERFLYVPEYPVGKVTVFPVPTEAVTLSINSTRQIAGPLSLTDLVALPPGYLRMLRYNLAVDLWPEYVNATTDINTIKAIAAKSLGEVKVANSEIPVVRFDDIPGVEVGRGWDWRIG